VGKSKLGNTYQSKKAQPPKHNISKDGCIGGVDRCGSAGVVPNSAGTGFCHFPVVVFTNRNSRL
jgi:hypothetical protein